jgi:hypothetical protein
MSFNRTQYENAAQEFFRKNPKSYEKYFSPTLLQTVVDGMMSSLPTMTAARIAFDRLLANGMLPRTDGKSEADDRAEAVFAAEARFNRVVAETDAPPLTAAETNS